MLLTWPHRYSDWGAGLGAVENVFVLLAREITRRQVLIVACYDAEHCQSIRKTLSVRSVDLSRVTFCIAPSNDAWARDHGPITVLIDGTPRLLGFTFNGWGGKYPSDLDKRISSRLTECDCLAGTDYEEIDFVLEGGSIETDGEGTLLSTASCLMSDGRNANLDRTALESVFGQHLGIKRTLWLDHGMLEGDDTDGHIDTLGRFTDTSTIIYCACGDPDDNHYAPLQAMYHELSTFHNRAGDPYRLIGLPLPAATYNAAGKRLPASYANFLIINGAVLMPAYEDPADARAMEILQTCFPDREVISIPCMPLIQQFGSLHCVTMQLPAGVLQN